MLSLPLLLWILKKASSKLKVPMILLSIKFNGLLIDLSTRLSAARCIIKSGFEYSIADAIAEEFLRSTFNSLCLFLHQIYPFKGRL